MLKKLNITTATLQVLKLLASDPFNAYHTRDLSKAAKVSLGTASNALRSLHSAQLLNLEQKGKMKFYRISLTNPIARHFKILFTLMALDELVNQLKDHSERVILYGSCAEGTDAKESDIDLFILTQDRTRAKEIVWAAWKKMERKLSPIIVDGQGLAKIRTEDKPLHESINRGIVLWQRE